MDIRGNRSTDGFVCASRLYLLSAIWAERTQTSAGCCDRVLLSGPVEQRDSAGIADVGRILRIRAQARRVNPQSEARFDPGDGWHICDTDLALFRDAFQCYRQHYGE